MHIKSPAKDYEGKVVKGPAGGSEKLHNLFFLCCYICDSGKTVKTYLLREQNAVHS